MEIKDWITIGVLIATIISSHWLVSVQTRKNKKVKWIDDLRLEVANFLTHSREFGDEDPTNPFPFSRSGCVITMLLDETNPHQNELIHEVRSFTDFILAGFDRNKLEEYKARVGKIVHLTKRIINLESKKI